MTSRTIISIEQLTPGKKVTVRDRPVNGQDSEGSVSIVEFTAENTPRTFYVWSNNELVIREEDLSPKPNE